jgi:aubergine-like protein
MGLQWNAPRVKEIPSDRVEDYIETIKKFKEAGDQMVVCITPGMAQREDRYNGIKKLCCCELAIPSQVIRSGNLQENKIRSVTQRIVIQMNCKLGGSPWSIQIPFKSCMIIGIDVYHDPSQKGKSVVAVVSSTNKIITKWFTKTYFQEQHQEIANVLETAVVSCLRKFYDLNHEFPARIFIYRDGVSDGQLAFVRQFEIVQIENAIMDFSKKFKDCSPTVSVIIVQKNINTKILMKTPTSFDNPPPGSVLDYDVTRKNYYDFFLISQFVNQGTVTPTYYVVIYDRNEMTPDRMQKLAYKTTHLYYNWFGTIRVPAPCLVS